MLKTSNITEYQLFIGIQHAVERDKHEALALIHPLYPNLSSLQVTHESKFGSSNHLLFFYFIYFNFIYLSRWFPLFLPWLACHFHRLSSSRQSFELFRYQAKEVRECLIFYARLNPVLKLF